METVVTEVDSFRGSSQHIASKMQVNGN